MDFPAFLNLLRPSDITLLIDVRSRPQSARFPHFDRIELEQALPTAGIRYLFLGDELGGRPDDPKVYRSDGLVDYRARRKSFGFRTGIERIQLELEKNDIALMCAEEDPITCHRFLMICPELTPLGIDPNHIRKGGVIESQRDAEDRLLRTIRFADVASDSLFSSDRESSLEDAYAAQAEKCAFRIDPRVLEPW